MSHPDDLRPFRWNLARPHELGRLADVPPAESYPDFVPDLLAAAARLMGDVADADLVFLGRSPESLFDLLGGILAGTPWAARLTLLPFSMRGRSETEIRRELPGAIEALRRQLAAAGLDPATLPGRPRPVALVDLVSGGTTFGNLARVLARWTREAGGDWTAVRRRLRFVGLTRRTQTSPKTWRWQQHADWPRELGIRAIRNVSLPGRLWTYLGDDQAKTTGSHPPWRWAGPKPPHPPRSAGARAALSLALSLYRLGLRRATRDEFARRLARGPAGSRRAVRALVQAVRLPAPPP